MDAHLYLLLKTGLADLFCDLHVLVENYVRFVC